MLSIELQKFNQEDFWFYRIKKTSSSPQSFEYWWRGNLKIYWIHSELKLKWQYNPGADSMKGGYSDPPVKVIHINFKYRVRTCSLEKSLIFELGPWKVLDYKFSLKSPSIWRKGPWKLLFSPWISLDCFWDQFSQALKQSDKNCGQLFNRDWGKSSPKEKVLKQSFKTAMFLLLFLVRHRFSKFTNCIFSLCTIGVLENWKLILKKCLKSAWKVLEFCMKKSVQTLYMHVDFILK